MFVGCMYGELDISLRKYAILAGKSARSVIKECGTRAQGKSATYICRIKCEYNKYKYQNISHNGV